MTERAKVEYIEPDQEGLTALYDDLKSAFMPELDNSLKLFPEHTPVAPCVRCGAFAEDPMRTLDHERVIDAELLSEEEKQVVCFECQKKERREQQETEVLELLESKLGLAEKDREALWSFIETIFTNPTKILQVKDLDNRVRSLERQTNLLWATFTGAILAFLIALAALVVSVFG